MNSNHTKGSAKHPNHPPPLHHPLNDDHREALAMAFGSHLIRNAPPHVADSAPILPRDLKTTRR